jgi:hypothetical protein
MANYRGGISQARKLAFKEMQEEFNTYKNDMYVIREWENECRNPLSEYNYFYAGKTKHINIDYITPYFFRMFNNVSKLNKEIGL